MPLPKGEWNINANGYHGILKITAAPPGSGEVEGTLTMTSPPEPPNDLKDVAFWDESAQKLTFIRVKDNNASKNQIYTGYMFRSHHQQPNSYYQMCGSFEAFKGTGATAERTLYGWTAHEKNTHR
jgi:hypothetical protein